MGILANIVRRVSAWADDRPEYDEQRGAEPEPEPLEDGPAVDARAVEIVVREHQDDYAGTWEGEGFGEKTECWLAALLLANGREEEGEEMLMAAVESVIQRRWHETQEDEGES